MDAIQRLNEAGVPYLIGGAYALFHYTGIVRDTKDLDLMVLQRDVQRALEVLARGGYRTELTDDVWLAKAYGENGFIDFIFGSRNGCAMVDETWFAYAKQATLLGQPCRVAPAEEVIWMKSYVNARDRFDGADINHMLYRLGPQLDWPRLVRRFGEHGELLLAHLVLYQFVFPGARSRVPSWVYQELARKFMAQIEAGDDPHNICRGYVLAADEYAHDYAQLGFERVAPDEPCGSKPVPPQATGT